jgi:hypothetical protein
MKKNVVIVPMSSLNRRREVKQRKNGRESLRASGRPRQRRLCSIGDPNKRRFSPDLDAGRCGELGSENQGRGPIRQGGGGLLNIGESPGREEERLQREEVVGGSTDMRGLCLLFLFFVEISLFRKINVGFYSSNSQLQYSILIPLTKSRPSVTPYQLIQSFGRRHSEVTARVSGTGTSIQPNTGPLRKTGGTRKRRTCYFLTLCRA